MGADDDDIESGAEIVSLKDPITMGRITIPARGKSCNHIQCFDAETFMAMNSKVTEPRVTIYGVRYPECPVCFSKLLISDMVIDGYFKEILDTASTECEQVQIESDGKWSEFKKPIGIPSSSKRKSGVVLDIEENHKSISI